MKKNLKIIILLIIILVIIMILLTNKTFLKNSYVTINGSKENIKIPLPKYSYYLSENTERNGIITAKFYSLKTITNIEDVINTYINNLAPCSEDFFQDESQNVTIFYYEVENKFPFNIISLSYGDNSVCNGSCDSYENPNCN